jgi:hypothetical protein
MKDQPKAYRQFITGRHLLRGWITLLAMLFLAAAQAQSPGSYVIVKMEDGTLVKARFKSKDNSALVLVSSAGSEFTVPLFRVSEITLEKPEPPAGAATAKEKPASSQKWFNLNKRNETNQPQAEQKSQKIAKSNLQTGVGQDEKERKSGTFGFGYGTSYGGIGVQLSLKAGFIGFSAGAGYFPASFIAAEFTEYDNLLEDEFLYNAGLKLYFGKQQKFYLHGQYGRFGVQAYQYTEMIQGNIYVESQQTPLTGITVLAGLDLPLGDAFGLNASLGLSKNMTHVFYIDKEYWPAADLGFVIFF